MPTSEDGIPRPPSYESLRSTHQWVRLTPEARRLFWTLNGPLSEAVSVMRNERDPDPSSLEPYYSDKQTWHEVSRVSLTEPEVSSITVACEDLERWEDAWLECHRDCTDPDDFADGDGQEPAYTSWGCLPDYDPDQDEDGPKHLLACCGTQRPRGKASRVVVRPTVTPFITINDYLETIHPWLSRSREDLLAAMGVWELRPLPAETKLIVDFLSPERVFISKQDDWMRDKRLPSNPLLESMVTQESGSM